MMKIFLSPVFLLLSSCAMAAEMAAAEYETAPAVWVDTDQGLKYSDSFARFDCSRQKSSIVDAAVPYFECGREGDWFSVVSPWLVFAYNLTWPDLPEQWERNGYVYSVVSKRVDNEFGPISRVAAYSRKKPEEIFVIDFSKRRGIVQFLHLDSEEDASEWFRLTAGVGLGLYD